MHQVLWVMATHFAPMPDIDLVQKAWPSGSDPVFLLGNLNNRILSGVEVPEKVRAERKAKFPQIFKSRL